MSKWLLSVVGIVFLGVLVDLIYPNGKTNKYCRSIFAIISMFVLISPILKIKDINFNLYPDGKYIDSVVSLKNDSFENQIIIALGSLGIIDIDVEIDGIMVSNEYEIQNVYIDITNIVLSENMENINKYEVITREIQNITGVDESKIFIYG